MSSQSAPVAEMESISPEIIAKTFAYLEASDFVDLLSFQLN
jgi:DNA-binding IscR family transcriptional regulator